MNIKKSRGAHRAPWLTIILSLIMVGLYFLGTKTFDLFLFDKAAILNGETWRFLTGHFVHCNMEHLFWDMAAFVIIGSVIELNNPKHLIPSFLVSCCFVSTWLFIGEPNLTTYCGLSGALNGMLVLAAILQWKATKEKMCLFVLLSTALKIVFEFLNHQTIFTGLAAQAVPSSHAAGFLAGILYLLSFKIKKKISYSIGGLYKVYDKIKF